jgi:hypothetical protein
MKRLVLGVLLFTELAWAVNQTHPCPQDGALATWTGQKKAEPYRPEMCEYSHKTTDSRMQPVTHVFWVGCDTI